MHHEVVVAQPPGRASSPAILIMTVVLTVLCGIHLCLPAFCCLVPALIMATIVRYLHPTYIIMFVIVAANRACKIAIFYQKVKGQKS